MPLTLYPGQTVMGSGNVFVYGEAAPNIEIVPGPGQSISIPPPSSFSVNADGWNYAVTGYSPTDGAPYDWSLTVSPSAAPGDYIADFWAQESLLLPEYGDRLPFTVVAGSSSSGTGTASSSSASSNSGGNGSSGSSGGGCLQPGTTGTLSIGYDSIDPIYSESAGYWVVFDDTVKVVADIDTPYGWTMDFDDPSNPSVAFVGVDPEAVSCNYFINYYIPLPSSSSSSSGGFSSSSSSSSGSSGSSSSSGSNGSYEDVALFVASFCVGAMSSSSSSLAAVSSSSLSSASSSSGGRIPITCSSYKNAFFNWDQNKTPPYNSTYSYPADSVTFHGTNNVTTPVPIQGANGNYQLQITPQTPLGVCIPSKGYHCEDFSWTNFQDVLDFYSYPKNAGDWPNWEFHYVGDKHPLPEGSLLCHTYEALLGSDVGYVAGQLAHFGVRFHLEYCPGSSPPEGTPTTNLQWIQVVWVNFQLGNCSSTLYNLTDAGSPYFTNNNGGIGLTVIPPPCETSTSVLRVNGGLTGVYLVDHPQTSEQDNKPYPRIFRAETFLCQDVGQNTKGGRIVNVYNGVQWGFRVDKLP